MVKMHPDCSDPTVHNLEQWFQEVLGRAVYAHEDHRGQVREVEVEQLQQVCWKLEIKIASGSKIVS